MNQTRSELLARHISSHTRTGAKRLRILRASTIGRVVAVALVLLLAGGGAPTARQTRVRTYSMATAGWGFDLVGWEAQALWEKATAALSRPAAGLSAETAPERVLAYLARADRIDAIENEIAMLVSGGAAEADLTVAALDLELSELRDGQAEYRLQVEQAIERQVSEVLEQAGFGVLGRTFPPVQFTFTEPPKKLVVSPRDRITTEHSRMLSPGMPLSAIEEAEAEINDEDRSRAYITNIGGLGAYPTMVVDRASRSWILSTVAHEWTHNYLTLFPLGWNYFKNQELTTLNESVAEIVGNEIGAEVERRFYAAPEESVAEEEALPAERLPLYDRIAEDEFQFDIRQEMRATRVHVDYLLAQGRVEEAERYMEERRQMFVDHGVPLRVLNQAYFAFHGSYGTSASSTSPIGPKLYELRALTPNLETFLTTVRSFTDGDDLDAALREWTTKGGAESEPTSSEPAPSQSSFPLR